MEAHASQTANSHRNSFEITIGFGEVRECFIGGSEEEQETRYNKTMLQKRLGELWHKTRQLIVD